MRDSHMQLLQMVQELTDALEYALRAGGWKLFEFEDQGKFKLIGLLGNM